MKYLTVIQRVKDFDQWLSIFHGHSQDQKNAGLENPQVFLHHLDKLTVMCVFEVFDLEKARAFVSSAKAERAQNDSGMIGKPVVYFTQDI